MAAMFILWKEDRNVQGFLKIYDSVFRMWLGYGSDELLFESL